MLLRNRKVEIEEVFNLKNFSIVHNMKTNILTQNGNINFGSTVQNSHTANLKIAGACFSFGDGSCVNEIHKQMKVIEGTKETSTLVQ